jgi:nucleoside-diphosphate-sugar epimerase
VNAVPSLRTVLVTGGAGFVGAVLVPRLLRRGYRVRVLDLYLFGTEPLAAVRGHPELEEIRGDIRARQTVEKAVAGVDAVIHLACISNDPSCELDPGLTRAINHDAFAPLVDASRDRGVRRFIFASSSSVYGVSDAPSVTEEHPRLPITDYNRYKALCEDLLFAREAPGFTTVSIRPATVCGRSPRQRLDLVVNILAAQALARGTITVLGGAQQRPSIHIQDMVDLYELLLEVPAPLIAGQAFNAAHANHTVAELATLVKRVVEADRPEGGPVAIETAPSNDPRSYHICTDKIRRRLGFAARRTIEDAVRDLAAAFRDGSIREAMSDDRYYNVRLMKARRLQ